MSEKRRLLTTVFILLIVCIFTFIVITLIQNKANTVVKNANNDYYLNEFKMN